MTTVSFKKVMDILVFNFWDSHKQSWGLLSQRQDQLTKCSLAQMDFPPKNLAYWRLTSTFLSGNLRVFEAEEVIPQVEQAPLLLRELSLESSVSKKTDKENNKKAHQAGTADIQRLAPVLVEVAVYNIWVQPNVSTDVQVWDVETWHSKGTDQCAERWELVHLHIWPRCRISVRSCYH